MQQSVIPRVRAPSDLTQTSMAIVIGNQVYGVPAIELTDAFGFQPLDSDLTAIAALATTAYGRSLLESVSASALFTSIKQAATTSASGVVTIGTEVREKLTANRTYYVRTDGSNSNNGLANTSGGAFLTIQKAINVILTLDLSGFDVTISVADGTYTGVVQIVKNWVGGNVTISGSTSAIISVTSNHCILTSVPLGNALAISGMKLTTTTAGDCIRLAAGGRLTVSGTEFGACAAAHVNANAPGALIEVAGNYSITGAAARHVQAQYGGMFRCTSKTITITGTPAFSDVFALADTVGNMLINGNTFSGSATGKRYNAVLNGVINTNGGGASALPGDVAGTTATGGQYA